MFSDPKVMKTITEKVFFLYEKPPDEVEIRGRHVMVIG
jgi:hypothetical protein